MMSWLNIIHIACARAEKRFVARRRFCFALSLRVNRTLRHEMDFPASFLLRYMNAKYVIVEFI